MKKYNLCIADTKKIVDSSNNLDLMRYEKRKHEELSELEQSGQKFLIYTDTGILIE